MFSIEDNGNGFDQNIELQEHYGLANMKSRAKELGATLEILSHIGNGTKVILKK